MQKYLTVGFMILLLAALQTKAFAGTLTCRFKDSSTKVEGVKSIHIADDALIINETSIIPLEHTRIKCGQFGKQHRFDGNGKGLQIILKSCTDRAVLEGHLIDSASFVAAEVACDEL